MLSNFKEYMPTILLAAVLFVPAFFTGGRDPIAIWIFFVLLGILLFVLRHDIEHSRLDFRMSMLGLFALWMFVQTFFFSTNVSISINTMLPFIAGIAVFYLIVFSRRVLEESTALLFSIGASALVFVGLVFFLQSANFGYLRLISTFYHHNGFAGFLVPFAPLFAWIVIEKRGEWGRILPYAIPILFFTGFILTFSRGGYISAFAALAVYFILKWKESYNVRFFFKQIGIVLLLITMSGVLAYGIFSIKRVQGVQMGVIDTTPFKAGGLTGVSSLDARFRYMNHALLLFKDRPFTGIGLGLFPSESFRIPGSSNIADQTYSMDPHNLYLRLFTELGFFGGVFFILFVAGILLRAIRNLAKFRYNLLYSALFSGFVGMLIHNGGDFDFQFPVNIALFFIFAGFLASSMGDFSK